MIILYSSETGHTRQYAQMLGQELGLPIQELKAAPKDQEDRDAIYLGWLLAGAVVGYKKAARRFNVKAVVGVGMTPESPEQTAAVAEKLGAPEEVPVFYLQGGYNFKKLPAMYKLPMRIKSREILASFEDKSEVEKQESAVYRMLTRGDSVVSRERLAPVIAWYRERPEETGPEETTQKRPSAAAGVAVAALGIGLIAAAVFSGRSSPSRRWNASMRKYTRALRKRGR